MVIDQATLKAVLAGFEAQRLTLTQQMEKVRSLLAGTNLGRSSPPSLPSKPSGEKPR
jgi:hypothetical protein